jgi:hypothetical protein
MSPIGLKSRFGASLAAFVTLLAAASAPAQENHGVGYFGALPYRGDAESAMADSGAKKTIPLAMIKRVASKDGRLYTDTIVGGRPFAAQKGTTTVDLLIVPLIVQIGGTTFDPTQADACITGGATPLAAFEGSPLLTPVAFDGGSGAGHAALINGTNGGSATYIDAFRRAEVWKELQGSSYHTALRVTTAAPWTISAATVQSLGGGAVLDTNCAPLGVLHTAAFQNYVTGTLIPSIPQIKPTTLVLFLAKDVVTTGGATLNCLHGCEIGYHGAVGAPVQTYSVAEYDTTAGFWNAPGITNISIIAHEMGEWLDDPLVTNPTPAWGGIGQVAGCQTNWEVGDPLTGTDFPAILMTNGLTYTPQELAFYSWYYDANGRSSLGAGGKFSMNGSFSGPSKACPPGGTY